MADDPIIASFAGATPWTLLVAALVGLSAGQAHAQLHQDSTRFLTGPCPGVTSSFSGWDAVVTDPDRAPMSIGPSLLPKTPDSMRRREKGYSAEVVVSFVVDAKGRFVPGTAIIVRSTEPDYSSWACEAATTERFEPAKKAGRAVAVLVEKPYMYQVGLKTDTLKKPY